MFPDAPPQWEATLQGLLAQGASLSQWVDALQCSNSPLPEQHQPLHDQQVPLTQPGLHACFTDLHFYEITHCPDITALKEVGPRVSALWGYVFYVFDGAASSTQGLATYVRLGTVIDFEEMGITDCIKFITISLCNLGERLSLVNRYVHAGALNVTKVPDYVHEEPTVLVGDVNSCHRDLGSNCTTNVNGVRWKAFLDVSETAVLMDDNVPTHVQGAQLDYVALINMQNFTAETLLSRCLPRDHSAQEMAIPIQSAPAMAQKQLAVPAARLLHLAAAVGDWYSTSKGSFPDAISLYQSLVDTTDIFAVTNEVSQPPARWYLCQHLHSLREVWHHVNCAKGRPT